MKKCHHCQSMIDDRSVFCPHCGERLDQPKQDKIKEPIVEEVVANNLGSLALIVFFVGLVGFDFLLPTLFDYLSLSTKIPFYFSTAVYGIAIAISVLGLFDFYRKKNSGLSVSSKPNSTAFAVIVMSIFLLVINVTQVLMK